MPKTNYYVSASHNSPDFCFTNTEVEVSSSSEKDYLTNGYVQLFYASHPKLGCGKTFHSATAAINGLFRDHACVEIEIKTEEQFKNYEIVQKLRDEHEGKLFAWSDESILLANKAWEEGVPNVVNFPDFILDYFSVADPELIPEDEGITSLQDKVLSLLSNASIPANINDQIMLLISEGEKQREKARSPKTIQDQILEELKEKFGDKIWMISEEDLLKIYDKYIYSDQFQYQLANFLDYAKANYKIILGK